MKIGNFLRSLALVGLGLGLLAGCQPAGNSGSGGTAPASGKSGAKQRIQNRGSDTLIEIAQAWSEAYSAVNKDVSVEVSGGGSGVGITGLITGTVELANSSRQLTAEEKKKAKDKSSKDPVEFTVGYDALAVYVHKDNPLDEITLEQLKQIYVDAGTITSWSQLGVKNTGCPEDKIVVVSRQNNSGTYEYFKEHVLGKTNNFRLGTIDSSGSKDVVALVGKTPCAIGYSGMGYKIDSVKFLKIKNADGKSIAPSIAAVHDKSYPISRPLYMYTLGEPADHLKAYIDWIRSDVGQAELEKTGYVSLQAHERAGGAAAGGAK